MTGTEVAALAITTAVAVAAGWQMHRLRRALIAERAARRLRDAAAFRDRAAEQHQRAVERARVFQAVQRTAAELAVLAEANAVIDAGLARLAREVNGTEEGGHDG